MRPSDEKKILEKMYIRVAGLLIRFFVKELKRNVYNII